MKNVLIAVALFSVFGAHAEVKLANGDQFSPAMNDFLISLSDNYNRLGLTAGEADQLIAAVRSGRTFSSTADINSVFTSNGGSNNYGADPTTYVKNQDYSKDKSSQSNRDQTQDQLISEKANQSDLSAELTKRDKSLSDEATDRKKADDKHDAALAGQEKRIDGVQSVANSAITQTETNAADVARLDAQKADKASMIKAQQRADDAWDYASENGVAIKKEGRLRSEGDAQTLKSANAYTDQKVNQLDGRIDDNRKRSSAGISSIAAMANIPQVSQSSTLSVGAGVGYYDSEQAIAVGFSTRIHGNIVTKASLSNNTQQELALGAGVSYEW